MSGLLFDTCALVYFAQSTMNRVATERIKQAGAEGEPFHISAVSAWELADNARKGRTLAPYLLPTPEAWYAEFIARGFREAPLTSEIAFAAARLPMLHNDPLDRFVIATARHLGLTLVTRDSGIERYAEAGLVDLLAC